MAALTPAQVAAQKTALDTQIADTNKKISDLTTATLVAKAPTQDTYFNSTKETKVSDAAIQQFADAYKPLYEKYKGVNMSTGTVAGKPGQKAFYTFDATSEATREADRTITTQTNQHQDYLDQQKAITQWINQQQSLYSNQLFDRFFNDMLKQQHSMLQQGYITNASALFDINKWNQTAPQNRGATNGWEYFPGPNRNMDRTVFVGPSYWYKDPTAVASETNALKSMYQDRFNSDKKIQDQYRAIFLNELQQTAASLQTQRKRLG